MRRFLPPLLLSLLLAGCGGGAGNAGVTCEFAFWNGEVGTCLPQGWQVLNQETLDRHGVPQETVAAFQSTSPRDGQFDTVTVTREPLAQDLSSLEYSDANVIAVSALPEYRLHDRANLTIDGQDTQLHIFAARPVQDNPVRKYFQVSVVRERTGYTFTGSLPLSAPEQAEQTIRLILRNATLTPPEGE